MIGKIQNRRENELKRMLRKSAQQLLVASRCKQDLDSPEFGIEFSPLKDDDADLVSLAFAQIGKMKGDTCILSMPEPLMLRAGMFLHQKMNKQEELLHTAWDMFYDPSPLITPSARGDIMDVLVALTLTVADPFQNQTIADWLHANFGINKNLLPDWINQQFQPPKRMIDNRGGTPILVDALLDGRYQDAIILPQAVDDARPDTLLFQKGFIIMSAHKTTSKECVQDEMVKSNRAYLNAGSWFKSKSEEKQDGVAEVFILLEIFFFVTPLILTLIFFSGFTKPNAISLASNCSETRNLGNLFQKSTNQRGSANLY